MASITQSVAVTIAPAAVRQTLAYWLPVGRLAEAKARNVIGHAQYTDLGYLDASKTLGMQADFEMFAHDDGRAGNPASGAHTPQKVFDALTAAVNGGYRDTIRRVLMIDEPDQNKYPANHWDMNKFREMYAAAKSVGTWPVSILVRADSNSYPKCVPWFDGLVSDRLGWDPYLCHLQSPEAWITTEGQRLRTGMGPAKPLQCVLQAAFIGWVGTGATRPTVDKVRTMGLAALAPGVGCSDLGLWFESDWGWMEQPNGMAWNPTLVQNGTVKLPNIPPTWPGIKTATDAWQP